MIASKAVTVDEYINLLSPERQDVIKEMRKLILKNLPKGYKEYVSYGMLTYGIPLEEYSDTYNKQPLGYLALAAQKNYNSLYLMCVYMDPLLEKELRDSFKSAGKKLDMGKSCIRFKTTEDLELKTIAKLIAAVPPADYIRRYEEIKGISKK